MSKFNEALECCCSCCSEDPMSMLKKPDMSRYSRPISWTGKPLELFGSVDIDVEEGDGWLRVTQETSPLLEMPLSMKKYQTTYFSEPPISSQ